MPVTKKPSEQRRAKTRVHVKTVTSSKRRARRAVTANARMPVKTQSLGSKVRIEKKTTRIDVRAKARQKEYLIYAASLLDMDLTSFVLTSAVKEAEKVISENVEFSLKKEQWDAFCDALDQPPRTIPKLRKLFKKKSIFKE